MSTPIPLHGFVKLGSRYVPATLVSQHEWRGALTLKFENGDHFICQPHEFLPTKPLTPYQQAQVDKKQKELAARLIIVERVKEQLGPEPKRLGAIAEAIGLTAAHLVTPLLKWPEFNGVQKVEGGWVLK